MKLLEFKDNHKNKVTIPLFKSFFKSVSYPLSTDVKQEATLYTHDNEIVIIPGTDFQIIE